MTSTFSNIAGAVSGAVSGVSGAVSGAWNAVHQSKGMELALDKLTQDQLIQIADYIRDIFKNSDFLDPPTLCVVGAQSSGKSITLNGLTGIDILPNGKSIVTRTPIHLRLVHVKDAKTIVVEFFDKDDSQKLIASFTVDAATTPSDQLTPIRNEIIKLTEQYAGKSKNVVDIPIDIRIKSPNVPNLSVIDLPGLTNIALTDQGQPEAIKQNIENMLVKYIKNPRTIILSIVPAIIDVESDMGLGLIKQFDPEFKRTIGVLTKIDMLKDSSVEHYLSGKISKNLQLGYGYYIVRNRSSDEVKTLSVKDGYVLEEKYFAETEPYKSSEFKSRMGSRNLGYRLSEILLAHLRACLPTVMEEIKNADKDIEMQLDEIGRDYPTTDSAKRSTLNMLLHEFQREYESSIKERGGVYNAGAKIAGSVHKFKESVDKLDPCNSSLFTDYIVQDVIKSYNGIHMPDVTISTGIIEKCFQGIDLKNIKDKDSKDDKKNKNNSEKVEKMQKVDRVDRDERGDKIEKLEPLKTMRDPANNCIKEIQNVMIDLVDNILKRDRFSRFPNLCLKIRETITGVIIPQRYDITNERIDDFFTEETECIWTDDPKFRQEILPNMYSKAKSGIIEPKIIRDVLSGYFTAIRDVAKHSIHKKIIVFFVNRVIEDINIRLIEQLMTKTNISQLLEEHKDKAIKRDKLVKMKEKINLAKSMISNVQ